MHIRKQKTRHFAVVLLTVRRVVHEVSLDLLLVRPKFVCSHECVAPVVEVCRGVQLQAAMVLSLCDVMDHGHDVLPLQHCFAIQIPL